MNEILPQAEFIFNDIHSLPREQAQAYVVDPSSSDSRRGLKCTWQEASSVDTSVEPVAGGSRDKPHKLTSAEKVRIFTLFVCGYFFLYNFISAGHLKKNMRFRVKM